MRICNLKIFLYNNLIQERDNWILWVVAAFMIGILIFFKLPYDPTIIEYIPLSVIFIISCYLYKKFPNWRYMIAIIIAIILGFLIANIRTIILYDAKISSMKKIHRIEAIVESISPKEKSNVVILKSFKLSGKIRLTARTKLNDIKAGDKVSVLAILDLPHPPVIPDSYDFARYAYFKSIAYIGYTISDFKKLDSNKNLQYSIENIRYDIVKKTLSMLGNKTGSIATALIVGEYSAMDKELLKNMRISGLAHILSVSGLHLSLAASIVFFIARFFLNLSNYCANELDVKKISAILAALSSFLYLILSSVQIAALRSFLMVLMVIIAIMIDRRATVMRSIAFAALIILIFEPENAIYPSFQMSFSAVIALVSFYDLFKKIPINNYNFIIKCFFYCFSIMFSSLVAGLATAPFVAYHFHQLSAYSIFANVIAIPITSFFLMPCVILAIILYPFGGLEFILGIMKYGIWALENIAYYFTNLPDSVYFIPTINDINLFIIMMGFLWLCLWENNWRYYGFILIFFGIITLNFTQKPDIIIDARSKNIIFKIESKENDIYYLSSSPIRSEFTRSSLNGAMGTQKIITIKSYLGRDYSNKICNFVNGKYKISVSKEREINCLQEDILIIPNNGIKTCLKDIGNIMNNELDNFGGHMIFLKESQYLKSVKNAKNKRLWEVY